jgi:hypothetical protein
MNIMLAKDFADFVRLLNKHSVAYMVVGGYALAFHGRPRYTGDLDIWIRVSEDNAEKILKAIEEFGLASLGFSREDFMEPALVSQIGYPPLRIDILNSIDGVGFDEAYMDKRTIDVGGIPIPYIGLNEFIQNKRASGRSKDLIDIQALQKKSEK